jgi:transcriptional regulator with XRE-family HTH domain
MYKDEYENMVEPYQLKALRESYGVSVSEIAKKCNLSFETVKRIEHTSTRLNTVEGGKVRYKKDTYDMYRRALINYVSDMRFDGRRFDQKVIFRNLKKYCNDIGITHRDFCLANELNFKFFEHPLTIPGIESILQHNPNWTMDDLEIGIKVVKHTEKETKSMENTVPYDNIITTIDTYCKDNDITKKELSLMCGLGENGLAPFSVRKMSENQINKILRATGWSREQLYGECPMTETIHRPVVSKPLVVEPVKDNFSIEDSKQYTPKQYKVITKDDGTKEYICEWDLVMTRHMVQHLSREEFLKEV